MAASWHIQSPPGAAGAVGLIAIAADDGAELDGVLATLGIQGVGIGQVALRNLCGIDHGIIARCEAHSALLMPHGGIAVMRLLARRLDQQGFRERTRRADPRGEYPEAATLLEARMLGALARAASPLAIDLLLDQPRRWPAHLHNQPDPPPSPGGEAPQRLGLLIDPPLVVALGAANIGKSSLANALAGRVVAIVADEPGTTRDHIGVAIDMAGVVVRYVDTPGLRPAAGGIESQAVRLALDLAARADLLLLCGDSSAEPPGSPADRPGLRVALRSDLGAPAWPADAAVSVKHGRGVPELVALVRDTLAPPSSLQDPRPWRFWGA